MKKIRLAALFIIAAFIFTSCAFGSGGVTIVTDLVTTASGQTTVPTTADQTEATTATVTAEATTLADPEISQPEPTGSFSLVDENGAAVLSENNVYTITSAGEYTATGTLEDGQITVDATDSDKVVIYLSDASISCSTGAPILALEASKVEVKAKDGTYNTVTDARTGTPTDDEDDTEDYNGAIYAKCDLEISGKGTLVVTSGYDNGIKSKDDLKIKNLTLKVTAPNNALKGNDSVTVESGSVILVSTAGDGIKTSSSDVSSKGKQRGTVTVSGGHVDIYAACDGIQASYNADISGDETVVNIFTSKYSSSGDVTASTEMYLILSTATYNVNSDYYAYFYNEESDGKWVQFTFDSMVYSGRTAYYGLKAKAPSGYQNVIFNIVSSGQQPDGVTYVASSDGETVNTLMNAYLVTSVSSKLISGDWVSVSSSSGSSTKTTYSSKGIKVENELNISGGTVTVYCMDDGLHANSGTKFESGATGVGNINISGGSVTVTSADDGAHADGKLNITGGYVNIVESHEGLEANVVNIGGGTIYVYGDDDGINACKGASTPLINITGGYLDVTTPSGDTDAIDSNGNITISGGFTLVKGGSSSGMVAGSVDADGTVTVTGGTIIALGGICETPSSSSTTYTYISSGTNMAAGSYVLKNSSGATVAEFTLSSSYSSIWLSSDALALNTSYTLTRDGTTVLSWTQSSKSVGSAGNQGGFAPGGFGRGR